MSRYEQDNLETARRCDTMIRDTEQTDPNVLSSVVPRSSALVEAIERLL